MRDPTSWLPTPSELRTTSSPMSTALKRAALAKTSTRCATASSPSGATFARFTPASTPSATSAAISARVIRTIDPSPMRVGILIVPPCLVVTAAARLALRADLPTRIEATGPGRRLSAADTSAKLTALRAKRRQRARIGSVESRRA